MNNYNTKRRQQQIDKLAAIPGIDRDLLEQEYVNSTTKITISCDCCEANVKALPSNILKRGSVSCKTCHKKKISNATKKYKAPEWFQQRYRSIKQRTTDVNSKHYKSYGARGITCEFCDVDDMWEYVSKLDNCSKELTLDRIDNDGNYAKGNIRWASHLVQNNNQQIAGKGVRQVNGSPNFQARYTLNGKEVYLGTFKTYEEAANAVAKANKGKHYEL